MFKIVVYVPQEHGEDVKEAMFSAGAGRIGNYDRCCWQVLGEGQFRPLPGSQAFIGKINEVETVNELRIEMICAEQHLKTTIAAMKNAHPYEEVAFDVWKLHEL